MLPAASYDVGQMLWLQYVEVRSKNRRYLEVIVLKPLFPRLSSGGDQSKKNFPQLLMLHLIEIQGLGNGPIGRMTDTPTL